MTMVSANGSSVSKKLEKIVLPDQFGESIRMGIAFQTVGDSFDMSILQFDKI